MEENEKEAELLRFLQEREAKRKGIEKSKTPDLIEKKNLVKEAPSPVKKNKMKHVDMVLLLGVIAVALIWMFWPAIMYEGVEHETVVVYPANVVLDSFEDVFVIHFTELGGDGPIVIHPCDYVSVIFQLRNTGDEAAKDVSCFIKCCDHNGTILFAQMFTFDDLGPNSTAPCEYCINVCEPDEVMYIIHTIDVRWSPQGVNTYMKLTEM